MHMKNIAHRDIKPDNILCKEEDSNGLFQVMLTDFGFA